MPYVWECRCHCCGVFFYRSRSDAKWCGFRCRKRATRREVMYRRRWNEKWFSPEYAKHVPKWVHR